MAGADKLPGVSSAVFTPELSDCSKIVPYLSFSADLFADERRARSMRAGF